MGDCQGDGDGAQAGSPPPPNPPAAAALPRSVPGHRAHSSTIDPFQCGGEDEEEEASLTKFSAEELKSEVKTIGSVVGFVFDGCCLTLGSDIDGIIQLPWIPGFADPEWLKLLLLLRDDPVTGGSEYPWSFLHRWWRQWSSGGG